MQGSNPLTYKMFLCVKKIKKFICSLFAGGPREVEEHEM
jgi:hypothetical protein